MRLKQHGSFFGMQPLRPRSMLFTLYGDYAYPAGADLWLGSIVRLSRSLGISEAAARSGVARLAREGWLVARRARQRAFYGLSAAGRALIEEGTQRIYERRLAWNGRWCLLSYSIPESRRSHRDRIRKQLAWLGFGQLGGGTYVSPRAVTRDVLALIERHGVGGFARAFDAKFVGPGADDALVARCWNLRAIGRRYAAFMAHYGPQLRRDERAARARMLSDERAFAMRFALTHDFRRFPFVDPDLPDRLVPADWAGKRAGALFARYHALLARGAVRYFTSVAGVGSRPYS